jgi:phosphomevalonate kinase
VPGKLIFLGEYAVLEGADALVAAVDRYVEIEVSPSNENFSQLFSNMVSVPLRMLIDENGNLTPDRSQPESLLNTMNFSLLITEWVIKRIKESGISFTHFDLKIDTSKFFINSNEHKIGLGSSAAMTVALIVGLACFFRNEKDIMPNKEKLFRFACDTHFRVQGNRGSGIDIASSVYGGINIYNIDALDESKDISHTFPVSPVNEIYMLPVWSGVSASTRDFLIQVEKFRTSSESDYQNIITRLKVLSESGCVMYKEKNIADFIDVIHDYYKVLDDFSKLSNIPIVSEIHTKVAEIVYTNGGVYKPSGAGGGDIGLAFSDSSNVLENIEKELSQQSIKTLPLEISTQGIVIVRN